MILIYLFHWGFQPLLSNSACAVWSTALAGYISPGRRGELGARTIEAHSQPKDLSQKKPRGLRRFSVHLQVVYSPDDVAGLRF